MMRIIDRRQFEDKEVYINEAHIASIEDSPDYDNTFIIKMVNGAYYRVDLATQRFILKNSK